MLLGHLLLSFLVAVAVAILAALLGYGVLGALLCYVFGGSLTLLLLAGWSAWRARAGHSAD